jgi:hypothetical protein
MFEVLLLAAAFAAETPDTAALLRQVDAPRQAFLHSTVRMRVTIEPEDATPPTSSEFDVYLGNEDQQLVVFRDKRNPGRKFLMVGDKSWLIVPGSKNPIAVTASQRMLGASSFADIARVRLGQDYTGALRPEREPCGDPARPCRVMDITARVKSAPYAAGTLWIDDSGFLRKAVYKLASGKPAKEIIYRYRTRDGETVPAGLTLVDLLLPDPNGKTTIEYLERRAAVHPASLFEVPRPVGR